ncbi:hypothetical protein HZB01_02005 [Candidatus Woesearchaeota archaeon]|nr:hypothetical protein [Candidatus Woesearchaeota archaeon]
MTQPYSPGASHTPVAGYTSMTASLLNPASLEHRTTTPLDPVDEGPLRGPLQPLRDHKGGIGFATVFTYVAAVAALAYAAANPPSVAAADYIPKPGHRIEAVVKHNDGEHVVPLVHDDNRPNTGYRTSADNILDVPGGVAFYLQPEPKAAEKGHWLVVTNQDGSLLDMLNSADTNFTYTDGKNIPQGTYNMRVVEVYRNAKDTIVEVPNSAYTFAFSYGGGDGVVAPEPTATAIPPSTPEAQPTATPSATPTETSNSRPELPPLVQYKDDPGFTGNVKIGYEHKQGTEHNPDHTNTHTQDGYVVEGSVGLGSKSDTTSWLAYLKGLLFGPFSKGTVAAKTQMGITPGDISDKGYGIGIGGKVRHSGDTAVSYGNADYTFRTGQTDLHVGDEVSERFGAQSHTLNANAGYEWLVGKHFSVGPALDAGFENAAYKGDDATHHDGRIHFAVGPAVGFHNTNYTLGAGVKAGTAQQSFNNPFAGMDGVFDDPVNGSLVMGNIYLLPHKNGVGFTLNYSHTGGDLNGQGWDAELFFQGKKLRLGLEGNLTRMDATKTVTGADGTPQDVRAEEDNWTTTLSIKFKP